MKISPRAVKFCPACNEGKLKDMAADLPSFKFKGPEKKEKSKGPVMTVWKPGEKKGGKVTTLF